MKEKTLVFLFIFLFPVYSLLAANQYTISASGTTTIDEHSVCRDVTNQNATNALMVPTNTSTEWNSFVSNVSAGVATMTTCDPCSGTPALGTSCTGGTLFAGVFDGGKYMVTPGDCTDSATPTCDGTTDTLAKTWRGTTGTDVDIASVANSQTVAFSSPARRGDVVTTDVVADASISSNSAADFCNDMDYGGYTDWYLPSSSELGHIYCKSTVASHDTSYPQFDPNCVQLGGKTSELPGFSSNPYWIASEYDNNEANTLSFDSGTLFYHLKSAGRAVRCIRRYDESAVDETPNAIAWADFTGGSTTETITGFDETIFLELTAANGTGAPTLEYQVNSNGYVVFAAGSSTLIAVRASDTIQFQASGTIGHTATITVKNATDDGSTPTLDTMVATAADPCVGTPTLGTTCTGGALYAGQFDSGKYMITPGGCNDSATPTCSGTDSVFKRWNGTAGGYTDIAGVENVSSASTASSSSYRGDVNTAAIVVDASIVSDSAADWCNDMTYGGYSDWYLPSKSEMAYIYCHSDVTSHNTSYPEEDPNCVSYGGKTSELTGFLSGAYHTSGEVDGTDIWLQSFVNGQQLGTLNKGSSMRMRCVRRY